MSLDINEVLKNSFELASVALTGAKLALFRHCKTGKFYLFSFHGGMRPNTVFEEMSVNPMKLLLKMVAATIEDESWET